MAVFLRELPSGGVSLEFDEADFQEITAAIRRQFGEIRILEESALYGDIEFGGEHFVYYHEWDPCLLSQSEKGKSMLRLIAALPGMPH